MRKAGWAAVPVLLLSVGYSASAQGNGRGRWSTQGIPPGHLPPPGECRVWYEGRPPGHQPPPTDCRTAERTVRGQRNARVVYGDDRLRDGNDRYRDDRDRGDVYRDGRDRDRDARDRDRRDERGRAVPRGTYPSYPGDVYPERYPRGGARDGRVDGSAHPGWNSGYRDGLVKGREDTGKNRSYQPDRHQWYRSASRGYDRRYGLRGAYANVYRDGFTAGYDEAFRRR
jgi:hypothetical protein